MSPRRVMARLRRLGFGTLPLLAGLLMASGLLRLGDGTGQAIAKGLEEMTAQSAEADGPAPEDEIAVVLKALKEREVRLDEREAALDEREQRVARAETAVRAQLAEMAAAEDELTRLLKLVETAAEDDLARLTAVYENMKPAEAAALFSEMAPAFAAGFLGRMRPDAAAKIMAGLEPPLAYSVSVMLAGRHADLPQQ